MPFDDWATANPANKALFDPAHHARPADGWLDSLPSWPADPKGIATRAASGAVLSAIGPVLPELWGGSADLAESNLTTIKGSDSFGPTTGEWKTSPYGRTLHLGIREHAMGAIRSGAIGARVVSMPCLDWFWADEHPGAGSGN